MITLLSFSIGLISGFFLFLTLLTLKKRGFTGLGQEIINTASKQAEELKEKEKLKWEQKCNQKWQTFLLKMQKEENRLKQKELFLDKRDSVLEKRNLEVEKKQKEYDQNHHQLQVLENEIITKKELLEKELENLSTLSKSQAEEKLLKKLEDALLGYKIQKTHAIHQQIEEDAKIHAQKILSTTIQRLTLSCTSELTITTVPLPSDMMKGRIIGREGRNIRYLEELCGVNLVMDDTPSAILISGFDPIRKEVAKNALQLLIQDGRIHPTRIEEVVNICQENIVKQIFKLGNDAALETGVGPLHPEISSLLGKLYFRTSVGQNLLKHSIEVGLLMGLMASELGLDVNLAKKIGLLHDIGKALVLSKDTSHALAGYEFVLKYGESEKVANGIGAHHDEIPSLTVEGGLCSAADAISASRPGARSLSLEKTFRRMQDLEELSLGFAGVYQAFALQAGKELRVIVDPKKVDDAKAVYIAKQIAETIEAQIPHSGKIKITVLRQARAISYAL